MVSSASTTLETPPAANELELSVFGPGVGECIVIHAGNNEWIIIDSCRPRGETDPVAKSYLSKLGVDLASVQLLLATHFHDDHIGGMATLVEECVTAEFAMSAAMEINQFAQLVFEVDERNRLVTHTSSASEFASILRILDSRRKANRQPRCNLANEGGCLFRRDKVQITAISPSPATILNAHKDLASQILTLNDVGRFRDLSPNDLSVAVVVESPNCNLLLGADLENGKAAEHGWNAVLASNKIPKDLSHFFKIPHHGSKGSHHSDVWSAMVKAGPISIVTPYTALANPLPTDDDVIRIAKNSFEAYCTTWPHFKRPPKRRGVDGRLKTMMRTRHATNPMTGHVRLRIDMTNATPNPIVQLFGSAVRLPDTVPLPP